MHVIMKNRVNACAFLLFISLTVLQESKRDVNHPSVRELRYLDRQQIVSKTGSWPYERPAVKKEREEKPVVTSNFPLLKHQSSHAKTADVNANRGYASIAIGDGVNLRINPQPIRLWMATCITVQLCCSAALERMLHVTSTQLLAVLQAL